MKKFLLSLMAILCSAGMYADVVAELTFPAPTQDKVGSYTAEWKATNDYGEWSFFGFNNNNNGWAFIKCGRKNTESTASFETPVINAQLTDLTITVDKTSNVTSATFEVLNAGEVVKSGDIEWEAGDVVVSLTGVASGCSVKVNLVNSAATGNGVTQISKIVVNGKSEGGDVAVESVKLTDAAGNDITTAALKVSETLQLKAVITPSNATNKKVTWSVEGDAVSVEAGLVKAVAVGTATVKVTTEDGNKTASVAVTVSAIEASTIADFIANEGGACYLTGTVSNIKSTKYGNFDLTDETGTIYIYGCLTPEGEAQKFETLGVEEGDEIKVIASEYKLFNETKEAVNVIFVEKKTPETPVAVESVKLTNDNGEDMPQYASLTVTEAVQLKAVINPSNATNKNVSWEVMQDGEVISLDNGLVTALAPGTAAVVVTTEDGEKQAAVTFTVSPIQNATIADFIANEGGICYLTGVVSDMVMDKTDPTKPNIYGNFNLTDETGTIYVYGCLTPTGEKKKFDTLGVEEGNEIVVLAKEYKAFVKDGETTDEAIDVIFVENHGTPTPPPTYTFVIEEDGAEFTVTPSDNEVMWYVELLDAEYDAETVAAYFDSNFESMGSGLEYFTGKQTQSYSDDWYLDINDSGKIWVCAVSADYKRISDVFCKDFTNAINNIKVDGVKVVRFNLAGQKVGVAQKGIIIMNGKKVMVK